MHVLEHLQIQEIYLFYPFIKSLLFSCSQVYIGRMAAEVCWPEKSVIDASFSHWYLIRAYRRQRSHLLLRICFCNPFSLFARIVLCRPY